MALSPLASQLIGPASNPYYEVNLGIEEFADQMSKDYHLSGTIRHVRFETSTPNDSPHGPKYMYRGLRHTPIWKTMHPPERVYFETMAMAGIRAVMADPEFKRLFDNQRDPAHAELKYGDRRHGWPVIIQLPHVYFEFRFFPTQLASQYKGVSYFKAALFVREFPRVSERPFRILEANDHAVPVFLHLSQETLLQGRWYFEDQDFRNIVISKKI